MAQAVKIKKIESLSHDVLRIVLEKPAGISYQPGQACDVSINKEGWKEELRPFTFVSLEDEDHIEFNIKTYTDHKGVTNELRSLKVGDELLIGEVFGAIQYKGEGMFLAGGAGITPFLAIFNSLHRAGKMGNNTLLFGNKEQKDVFLEDKFNRILGKNYINVLSDEKVEGYEKGFIDADLIKKYQHDDLKYYYVCGPDPMMDAVLKTLKDLGIADDKIITEE